MKPILFHLQHLFGSGHIQRIRTLAEALADQGYPVALISGGREHPEIENQSIKLFQLPGITAGSSLSELVDAEGEPVDDALWELRSCLAKQIVLDLEPAAVIIEGFPFARRRFGNEILEIIDAAKQALAQPSLVLCSVRDIIQPIAQTDRQDQVIAILNERYDRVLVHGEEQFVPLEASFERLREIQIPVTYTGYLDTGRPAHPSSARDPELVIVSAGGGIAGQAIYETAIQAASTSRGAGWRWHILIGDSVSETHFADWRESAPGNVIAQRNRADFRQLLAACGVSVSQIGYNTAVDLVQSGTKGIVIPFEDGGEQEQKIRAQALSQCGHVRVLSASALDAQALVDSIARAMEEDTKPIAPFRADGTERFLREIASVCPCPPGQAEQPQEVLQAPDMHASTPSRPDHEL